MQCPKCGFGNPPGAGFCGMCGARLPQTCPTCGFANPPDHRFCSKCGTSLPEEPGPAQPPQAQPLVAEPGPSAVRLEGERRLATIVLADITGSTPIGERMGTEDFVEILNRVLTSLTTEIYRFGGEVDQFRGDCVVAFFGARVAHEDDPERAVLAALAMQEAINACNTELAEREGIELQLRVGVNTGEVIAAKIGDSRHYTEDTAMGQAVTLANRLETAAEPGTVLVSESTYRLTQPLFDWQPLGEITVKGVSQPVAVYRPLAAEMVPSKPRGIPGLASPLVGRQIEFRALQEATERLRAGVGGIVTIAGEAGIGKSRLVAELRKRARSTEREALQWVEGRCLSYGATIAYHLWLDMLRELLGVTGDAPQAVVHHALGELVQSLCRDCFDGVFPYLARMMSLPLDAEAETRLQNLEGESLKSGTFRAVERLVEGAALQQGPLVIVCEDLHWADSVSIELLEQLLGLTDRASVLFICVFRPEQEHGCWHIKETAARFYRHRHTDLWLEPLSTVESAMLMGNLLQVEDLPKSLRERILDRAEGNPFYVEEIIHSLIDSGAIAHDEAAGRWVATRDVADIAIPDTLHGVLTARIDRLQEETKQVLQLASVIGRIFFYRVLAAIAQEERELDKHLLMLQREEMIRERARVPELEYIFKHHLTQEAAYNGLLKRKRRIFHRQVAQALERLFPDRIEEQFDLLVHHWCQAEDPEREHHYAKLAGEQAMARFANTEALNYLSRALDLTPEGDYAQRYTLLLSREKVYDLQGRRKVQAQDLATLEQLAEVLNDDRKRAQVALRQANYYEATDDSSAVIAAAQEAIRLGQIVRDLGSEAVGYLHWGVALVRQGEYEAARTRLEESLDLTRAAQISANVQLSRPHSSQQAQMAHTEGSAELLRKMEADVLRKLGQVAYDQGDFADGRACHEQALRISREIGDRRGEGRALTNLGLVSTEQGDFADAEVYYQQALHIHREVGDRRGEARALNNLGVTAVDQGDYASAKAFYQQALRTFREIGHRRGEGVALGNLGEVSLIQGEYTEASDYLSRGLCIAREIGHRRIEGFVLVLLGEVSLAQGDYAGAGAYFEQAQHIHREIGDRQGEGLTLSGLSLLSHHLGDDGTAWEYSQQALLIAQELGDRSKQGDALIGLGHALMGLGQLDEAADAYEKALILRREIGQAHLIIEAKASLAHVSLNQKDLHQALDRVEEILSHLKTSSLVGVLEPFWIYLTCYHVLHASQDPGAQDLLITVHTLLQERADKIRDEELRRSFLENVAAHREIMNEWRAVRGE